MAWESIGVIQPTRTWQSFSLVSGSEVLRIIQTWQGDRPANCALIGQYLPLLEGIGQTRRIWAYQGSPKILILPIPLTLRQMAHLEYIPQIKLRSYPNYGVEPWQIEIQAFY